MSDDIRNIRSSPPLALSDAGVARRDRMLGQLVGEMQRVHRSRRGRRRAVAVVAPLTILALGLAWWRWSPQPVQPVALSPESSTIANGPAIEPAPIVPPPVDRIPVAIITMITTPHDAMDACRVTTASHAPTAEMLDDAQLLATLATLNRPAGLVRSSGKVWLTRDVTDGA